jgi:hypothetical protein
MKNFKLNLIMTVKLLIDCLTLKLTVKETIILIKLLNK